MNKTFNVGEEYQVFNKKESMSWNNTLRCVSTSNDIAEFEEIDENDNICGKVTLLIKTQRIGIHDYIEFCEIGIDCIVQAD